MVARAGAVPMVAAAALVSVLEPSPSAVRSGDQHRGYGQDAAGQVSTC